jgi:spore germination protein KA
MQESPQPLTHDLSTNLAALQAAFHTCCDFVTHSFEIPALNRRAALLFIDGLVNQTTINELALKPLVYFTPPARGPEASACETLDAVAERLLLFSEVKTIHTLEEARLTCLSGDALLLVDGMEGALECNAKGWERRSITEPQTETVIRGPREGFVETLRANTSLIRRRLRTQDLRVESMSIGERTSTPVSILYIEGIANPKLVTEVKRRLGTIHTDMVSNSGYIAEFIEDAPHSLFETVGYTEKPDVVAGKLMEGRVALIVDGTPFVLTAPLLFIEHFQSAEDYAIRPFYATFLRVLRLIAFVISMLAPAIFVAVVTYHQELIPNALLFTMAAAGAGLPFPSGVETALMLMIFEI